MLALLAGGILGAGVVGWFTYQWLQSLFLLASYDDCRESNSLWPVSHAHRP